MEDWDISFLVKAPKERTKTDMLQEDFTRDRTAGSVLRGYGEGQGQKRRDRSSQLLSIQCVSACEAPVLARKGRRAPLFLVA